MKHASQAALDALDGLLAEIRTRTPLKERKRGIFYRASKSCLHFHEDPNGLFADLTTADGFDRYRVETPAERDALLLALDHSLAAS